MKKLESLTEEQTKLMFQVRDEWTSLALKQHTKGIDKKMFEEGVAWLYKDILHKPVPKVVYCDSWLSCLITISLLKKLPAKQVEVGDSVWDSVWASVGASVRASVGASVGDSVWDSVRASVGASVRDSVRASVGDSVWDSVWASVGASVRASVGDSVGASVGASVWASVGDSYSEYSNYNGWSNFGWVSFYDFFERINVLDNFKFKQYKKLIKSNCFNAYEYDNFVFAIQPPIRIERNELGRLHSSTKSAAEFKDGSCYYFINGRNIPDDIFKKASTLTKKQFTSERNSDYKGAWYEILGQQKMMDMLGAKEVSTQKIVHKNGDTETVTLLKTLETFPEIDNQPFAWVKMICPSTGTQYLQGVEPYHTDALEAIASLSPFKKEEYSFDLRS